mmetsp:Transcript_23854/g.57519  ORF Transcript_23854/g.57519 Transcript_23854/m.57519 type:complete len:335 (-) Transcript_23854:95-1099(-)
MIHFVFLSLKFAAVVGTVSPRLPRRGAAFLLSNCKHVGVHTSTSSKQLVDFTSHGRNVRPSDKTNYVSTMKSPSLSTIHPLNLMRGGGLVMESIAIPSSSAILVVSKVMAACIMLLGSYALIAPVKYANSIPNGILEYVEEDSFDASLIEGTGAIVIGFAIHVCLALSNILTSDSAASALSLGQAMGYALLPRIALILWSFLRARLQEGKGEYQFQGTGFLKFNFFMMSWAAFSLLTGAGNPAVSAKIFSAMALIKAMALIVKPVKMTEKIFGVNVSEMPQSCFLSRVLGSYLVLHAILMLSLACGVNPSATVGVAAFASTILPFWILHIAKEK